MAERSNRRRRRDEDDDDDERPRKRRRYDEDEDEPPRRRKKKKAAGGNKRLLFALLGGGVLIVAVVVAVIFAFKKTDGLVNADKTPNADKGLPANQSDRRSINLAEGASTSFDVTFKKDHFIEYDTFAPVEITVLDDKGEVFMYPVQRGAMLIVKQTHKCKMLVKNISVGPANGPLEIKQTPFDQLPSPSATEKNKISLKGKFNIPPDVPAYTLAGKGVQPSTGMGAWFNTFSAKDARVPGSDEPYKLFQVDMVAGTRYTLQTRSIGFSTTLHCFDPAGRSVAVVGMPFYWEAKENGPHRFAVKGELKGAEGPFVVIIGSHKLK